MYVDIFYNNLVTNYVNTNDFQNKHKPLSHQPELVS